MKLAFTLALGATAVWAQSIPPAMYKQGCELLGKKIFCFGGAVRDIYSANPTYNDDFLSGHYVLDLSNFTTLQDAANLQWQQVPDPAGYQLEARGNFATAKVSDNSYIVFGGAGPKKTYEASALVNLTTIYSADTNTWRTVDTSAVPSDSPIAKQA
ncbi:hypothetical protein BC940DRAFT_39952 [Gongronella butleri]|nr:hypothetical protein BC940DRAFT_39952 [Gongronella butleri]